MTIPRLTPSSNIRIIAPSRSLSIISPDVQSLAEQRLNSLGLNVSYSEHASDVEMMDSGSVKARVDDLHQAFLDPDIAGILTVIGGFNSNQLLEHLDFELIKDNPKVFCGFSDISVLNNAIWAETGLSTFCGPHFSSFGMRRGLDYTLDYFSKCVMGTESFSIESSSEWSDDLWFLDQDARTFLRNSGMVGIQPGIVSGRAICGNLCSFQLLLGTRWRPSFEDTILFLEEAGETSLMEFDRKLQSLIHQPDFDGVKGLVVGRFQTEARIDSAELSRVLLSKPALKKLPIIINADFGHTTPLFTFPVGGEVRMEVTDKASSPKLQIIKGGS